MPPMADHSTHHEPLAACPNCETVFDHAAAPARYCPHCGQETVLHPPSVGEFLHEFVGHYVALEGALWQTLRLLVLRPGALTKAYLSGKRRRYVLPLRLYLTASFVFFLALKLVPGDAEPQPEAGVHAAAGAASAPASTARAGDKVVVFSLAGVHTASQAEAARLARDKLQLCESASGAACNWFERQASRASDRWLDDPEHAQSAFASHAIGVAPYAMFLMLPVFAAVVALAYRSRRMLFGEHIVFGMHLHAFAFLAATLALLLPDALAGGLGLLTGVYAVAALRRVYGGGWGATIARGVVIALVYSTLLGIVSGAVGLWLFLH